MKAYLTLQEVDKLKNATTNQRDLLLIHLLLRLGCRISELLAIKTDDINFDEGIVNIIHAKERLHLSCTFCKTRLARKSVFCPGCGKRVVGALRQKQQEHTIRSIPVDKRTLDLVHQYIAQGWVRNGRLFDISRQHAWLIVKQAAEKAGIHRVMVFTPSGKRHFVSPHRLRDAFAVNAMKVDDSAEALRQLQEHLGHKSFDTTAKYRKVSGEERKEWYSKLWGK